MEAFVVSLILSSGVPEGWWKKVGLPQQPVASGGRVGLLHRDSCTAGEDFD